MRYLLGFFIIIGLLILVVILVLKGSHQTTTSTYTKPLSSYASTDAVASFTAGGPIVADQNYRAIQIEISRNTSTINVTRGYQRTVLNTQSYPNNQPAFQAFLSALNTYGFSLVNSSYKYTTPAGFCSFNETYSYSLINDGKTIINSWATACGGQGNFKGIAADVNQLFIRQIPDYNIVTSNVNI